jgi:hypothetical protein
MPFLPCLQVALDEQGTEGTCKHSLTTQGLSGYEICLPTPSLYTHAHAPPCQNRMHMPLPLFAGGSRGSGHQGCAGVEVAAPRSTPLNSTQHHTCKQAHRQDTHAVSPCLQVALEEQGTKAALARKWQLSPQNLSQEHSRPRSHYSCTVSFCTVCR